MSPHSDGQLGKSVFWCPSLASSPTLARLRCVAERRGRSRQAPPATCPGQYIARSAQIDGRTASDTGVGLDLPLPTCLVAADRRAVAAGAASRRGPSWGSQPRAWRPASVGREVAGVVGASRRTRRAAALEPRRRWRMPSYAAVSGCTASARTRRAARGVISADRRSRPSARRRTIGSHASNAALSGASSVGAANATSRARRSIAHSSARRRPISSTAATYSSDSVMSDTVRSSVESVTGTPAGAAGQRMVRARRDDARLDVRSSGTGRARRRVGSAPAQRRVVDRARAVGDPLRIAPRARVGPAPRRPTRRRAA